MRKVEALIEDALVSCKGKMVPGVSATCADCDHYVEVPYTEDKGASRALAKLRETCPMKERNRYQKVI
jgi:hypothetical protein